MSRRNKILWSLLFLAVIVVTAGVGIYLVSESARRPENVFPMWIDALEPEGGFASGVNLTLTGIDYDQPPRSKYDGPQDVLHIRAVLPEAVGHGLDKFVDYFYDGKWYTVWYNQVGESLHHYSSGENDIQVWVPAGLFKLPGQYRIYLDGLGYCEYDNLMPLDT